jgi:hypothetical protein
MTTRCYLLALLVVLVAGCVKQRNPYYCAAPGDEGCPEPDADLTRCRDSTSCASPAVCDTRTALCVQCTPSQAAACTGTVPVCGSDDSCRGCQSHGECPASNTCLPDGSCAVADEVAYVAPPPVGTDNAICSMAAPCTKIAKALATQRGYLKLHGVFDEAVVIQDRRVTVLADPGATLSTATSGNILIIDGASEVAIYDLAITGASGLAAGIVLQNTTHQFVTLTRVILSDNSGQSGAILASGGTLYIQHGAIHHNLRGAITALNATVNLQDTTFDHNGRLFGGGVITVLGETLNVQRCRISNNTAGGISASSATVNIQETTFENNGLVTGDGGISVSGETLSVQRSTLANNTGAGITVSGAALSVQQSTLAYNGGGGISVSASAFDLQNNVIFKNGSASTAYGGIFISQLNGVPHKIAFNTITQNNSMASFTSGVTCQLVSQPVSFENNIVYRNTGTQVGGLNCAWAYSDIGPDGVAGPGNLNLDPDYVNAPQGNFRLLPGSPLIDRAAPGAGLATDIDGNARPYNGRGDIGAHEYAPP